MPLIAQAAAFGYTGVVGVTGTNEAGMPLQDVPAVAADLVDKDAFLYQISLTNNSGGALTVTVKDKQSSAKFAMEGTTIADKTTVAFNWENGLFMKGGINWVASGAGIDGSVVAVYRNV